MQDKIFEDFSTPKDLVYACMTYIYPAVKRKVIALLDPGAGFGTWGQAARLCWPDTHLIGVEIQPIIPPDKIYTEWRNEDFLTSTFLKVPDVIFGNPPFSVAEKFLLRISELAAPTCDIFFLLRSAFWWGAKRSKNFWPVMPLYKMMALIPRPVFVGNSSDPRTEYGLFHWSRREDEYIDTASMGKIFWK